MKLCEGQIARDLTNRTISNTPIFEISSIKDQSYEYCLESFKYAGRNLADTDETDGGITVSDWSEPEPNDDNEEDEIFVGYFEDSEALQEEDEPNTNDPRLTQQIGVYSNLRQTDQKPTYLNLQRTEIPIPPTAKG